MHKDLNRPSMQQMVVVAVVIAVSAVLTVSALAHSGSTRARTSSVVAAASARHTGVASRSGARHAKRSARRVHRKLTPRTATTSAARTTAVTSVAHRTRIAAAKKSAQSKKLIKPAYVAATKVKLGTVVIDAGHQGVQDSKLEPIGPGAHKKKRRVESGTSGVVTHVHESKVNLQVALRLRKALQARGVKVIMVRTSQHVDIPNSARARIANKNHAALFVRLHCDGVGKKSVHGFLMLRPGANKWTKPIVKRSKIAAALIDKSTLSATHARNRGIQARTDLTGFNWSKVPTILAEMGVMTNPTEDRKLSSANYQRKLATGLANGIVQYLKRR